ncbi:MAG: hypothetical protein ABIF40_03135 [archaeon]
MNWGQTFTQDIQESTSESGEQQLTCATDVVFDLQNVCSSTPNLLITIANNGAIDIEDFSLRIYKDESTVFTTTITEITSLTAPVLEAFGIKTYMVDLTGALPPTVTALSATVVEIIPQIIVGDEIITCSATIDDFGILGTVFDVC